MARSKTRTFLVNVMPKNVERVQGVGLNPTATHKPVGDRKGYGIHGYPDVGSVVLLHRSGNAVESILERHDFLGGEIYVVELPRGWPLGRIRQLQGEEGGPYDDEDPYEVGIWYSKKPIPPVYMRKITDEEYNYLIAHGKLWDDRKRGSG